MVIAAKFVLAVALTLSGQHSDPRGMIRGTVVNGSSGRTPSAQTEVILQVRVDGQFVPVAETVTNAKGQFAFNELPLGWNHVYLPGASRNGVHYHGPRVRLTATRPTSETTIEVRNAVAEPNPLIVRKHEIVLCTQSGALHVSESMLVDNPSSSTYIGRAAQEGVEPVTLELHISSDFERVTFEEEFFGRRFALVDGKLATGIPWTPGQRWLKFAYTLRNESRHGLWKRLLDLPTEDVRVTVRHDRPEEITCNLGRTSGALNGEVTFQSEVPKLTAGHEVCVELGQLPVSWVTYGRWAALVLLVSLVAGGAALIAWRRRSEDGRIRGDGKVARQRAPTILPYYRPARRSRRKRRRAS